MVFATSLWCSPHHCGVRHIVVVFATSLWCSPHCIKETFRLGNRLIVVAIDFEKDFDRVALIRAPMYYKCDPRLIDVVSDLYVGEQKYDEMGYWCVIQR